MTEEEKKIFKEVSDGLWRRKNFGPIFLVKAAVKDAEDLYFSGNASSEYKKELEKLAENYRRG